MGGDAARGTGAAVKLFVQRKRSWANGKGKFSALGNQKAHFHRVKTKLLLSEPPQASVSIIIHRGMMRARHASSQSPCGRRIAGLSGAIRFVIVHFFVFRWATCAEL